MQLVVSWCYVDRSGSSSLIAMSISLIFILHDDYSFCLLIDEQFIHAHFMWLNYPVNPIYSPVANNKRYETSSVLQWQQWNNFIFTLFRNNILYIKRKYKVTDTRLKQLNYVNTYDHQIQLLYCHEIIMSAFGAVITNWITKVWELLIILQRNRCKMQNIKHDI